MEAIIWIAAAIIVYFIGTGKKHSNVIIIGETGTGKEPERETIPRLFPIRSTML